jgi:alpha-amylase/alpha-mannosidase (GH57 family)
MSLFVHILWHMHQPWYWDERNRKFILPWVRTHATKDYLFMGKLLERFPSVRVTFNFTPSLLKQIELYLAGERDRVMELAERPALSLTEEEKREICDLFFLVSSPLVFASWPRYGELWEKRSEALSSFTSQDFLDLQVLYQLIWFDPLLLQEDRDLRRLHEKGRNYGEEDKALVFEVTMRVFREILPQYRKLLAEGQIEVTFSPFYHPILPLLVDTSLAQDFGGTTPVPGIRYAFPQDAREQIRRGREYAKEVWGQELCGMWPSEGSVSEETLWMAQEEGVQWVATGEEVLFRSLQQGRGKDGEAPEVLYCPHRLRKDGQEIVVLFRDRVLSDAIGFEYHRLSPQDAVEDFIRRLWHIRKSLPQGRDYVVSVILDGENAWEYYRDNGLPFLTGLYEALAEEKELMTTTPSRYLREHQEVPVLERLLPGSWIFGNFSSWIGHPEKNWAWERLFEVRQRFEEVKDRLSPLVRERAYELILQAEGSDWFWWLGEDHPSPQKSIFVAYFLGLLEEVQGLLRSDRGSEEQCTRGTL